MANINAQSLILQKIWAMLKFCDRQTDGQRDGTDEWVLISPAFAKAEGWTDGRVLMSPAFAKAQGTISRDGDNICRWFLFTCGMMLALVISMTQTKFLQKIVTCDNIYQLAMTYATATIYAVTIKKKKHSGLEIFRFLLLTCILYHTNIWKLKTWK